MHKLEEQWITKVGYPAVCIFVNDSHRCGYVELPSTHPLYQHPYDKADENLTSFLPPDTAIGKRSPILLFCRSLNAVTPDLAFDVHGGITFSGPSYWTEKEEGFFYGFDCAHAGDETKHNSGVVRSLSYVKQECENLAEQLAAFAAWKEQHDQVYS